MLVAWRASSTYRLVVAANRDEVYWRPTEPLHVWDEPARIIAGRDKPSHGTWLGVTGRGRFAATTNVRRGLPKSSGAVRSRGNLPVDFLASSDTPEAHSSRLLADGDQYAGFNVLLGDPESFWWASNIRNNASPLSDGIHGISNAALDTPWPKVIEGKRAFETVIDADDGGSESVEAYFDILRNHDLAPRKMLPNTGVGGFLEHRLSARFVRLGFYGTRSSTVLRMRPDNSFEITERRFGLFREIGRTRYTESGTRRQLEQL
ncbi:NRDE family protein [Aldersonia kunmingensis]|uniref:NRDE family protein n=1 Tax=Aldersonia kunmingensis TaxID=408066 RepID=UPI0012EDD9E4|nr:NRDE family protein [Aldersonia kunmingensis]